MKNSIILTVGLLASLNASAAFPPNMTCTGKPLKRYNSNFVHKNVELTSNGNCYVGTYAYPVFSIKFSDNSKRNFEFSDGYCARELAYSVTFEAADVHNDYFIENCGDYVNDGESYHFLISGGDYGPMMCLSCSEQ